MEKAFLFRSTGERRKPKYNESYRDAWDIKTAVNDVIGKYPIYERKELTDLQARLISVAPEMLEALKAIDKADDAAAGKRLAAYEKAALLCRHVLAMIEAEK